jgi:RNA polymerase sigma-70 factor (ECF subfamily)
MKKSGLNASARDLHAIFSVGMVGGLSDGQLLERFVAGREEAIFEAIVHRHGRMVWGVCRRVLRDHHDAEDAFQATFLVLARKAASVLPREKLPNWLYGVAFQTAMKARAMSIKRRERERRVPALPDTEQGSQLLQEDLVEFLDQELSRLPEKYRTPIILCELEGKSHRAAAEQLGCPIGTISGRLSRAKTMLAERLARRGVVLSTGALAVLTSQNMASAGMPTSLVVSTTKAAIVFAAGQATVEAGVSAKVAIMAEGVLKAMLMTKLKTVTTLLVAVAALGAAGTGSNGWNPAALASSPEQATTKAQAKIGAPRTLGITEQPPSDVDLKAEMKKLEATWAITDLVEGGQKLTDGQKAHGLGRAVIKDGKITVKTKISSSDGSSSVKDTMAFSFAIDPSKTPKLISLFLLNAEKEDEMKENEDNPILLGIYELKGDTLRISFGMDRPENFDSIAGPGQNSLTLKWAKW